MRPATAADIREYYGEPYRFTVRANAVLLDGKVVGIVGVAREYDIGKFFSDVKPELEPHLSSVTVWRAIKGAMDYVRAYRGPVLSTAEHAEGCVMLHRLGFKHLEGRWYGWLG